MQNENTKSLLVQPEDILLSVNGVPMAGRTEWYIFLGGLISVYFAMLLCRANCQ
jgi:hypothetical protein